MPDLTDEQAADLAIATINGAPSQKQLLALEYVEKDILSQIHHEHCFVDIQRAFLAYDALYFRGILAGKADVAWSARMTLCAGTCELKSSRNDGKRGSWPEGITVRIKLSEPILKFRQSVDVLNTLLHEMIHAYLFSVGGKHVRGDDPSGHGFGFLALANAINKHSHNLYSITVYHNFHDEVDHYRIHIWQCNGPCTTKPPYFGLVKRAMNRPPGPSDSWYRLHQETCGGEFTKIAGQPEKTKGKEVQKNKIVGWLKAGESKCAGSNGAGVAQKKGGPTVSSSGQGKKRRRDTDDVGNEGGSLGDDDDDDVMIVSQSQTMVVCPVCFDKIWVSSINQHLDTFHGL